MHNMVNKEIPTPVYYQIEESIRGDIAAGRLSPGDRLPTEQQLCDLFEVSRMTVRRALQDLISDGVIMRRRGHGPVVAPPRFVRPLGRFFGLFDTMAAQGILVTSRVLSWETLPASPREAQWLQIQEGEPVLFLQRLRLVDDIPLALQHTVLRGEETGFLRAEELEEHSLYHLLAQHGLHLEDGTQTVTARMPTQTQCRLLELSPQTPLLYIEHSTQLRSGETIEFSRSWYNSSRFSMVISLDPQQGTYRP